MQEFATEVFKQYGQAGLTVIILFFCGWLIYQLLMYFMKTNTDQSAQIMELNGKFIEALKCNAEAMNSLSQSTNAQIHSAEKILESYERTCDQHAQDHKTILNFLNDTRHKWN